MKAHFLFLKTGTPVAVFSGIKTHNKIITLPEIQGVDPKKCKVHLDCHNQPVLDSGGVIHEIYFKTYRGKKFSDPATILTAAKPNKQAKTIVILAPKRWSEINLEILNGKPNGSVGPGIMILNVMDCIAFTWEDVRYLIHNFAGEVHISKQKTLQQAA